MKRLFHLIWHSTRRTSSALGAVFALVVVALARVAGAQQPAPQDDFVPVGQLPAAAEQLPAAPFLIAAYAFVWVMVLFYLWTLWRRLASVEREMREVERRVSEARRT